MKLTWHKTEPMHRRSAIVAESDLSAGVKKLAALHGAENEAPAKVVPLAVSGRGRAKTGS
jgi:hypothetical protein